MARLQHVIPYLRKRAGSASTALGVGVVACLCLVLSQCKDKPGKPEPTIRSIYYTPAWSPDGTEIVSIVQRIDSPGVRSTFVSVLDAATGEVRRERPVDFPAPFDLTWTPDGQWLLFGASPGVFKLSSDLDSLVQLTSGEFNAYPSYSKARNVVFFTVGTAPDGGLFSVTLDGDSLRRWSTSQTAVLGTSAFPDSSDSLLGFDAMQLPFRLIVFSPDAIGSAVFLGGESRLTDAHISWDHRYVAYNSGYSLVLLDRAADSSWSIATNITNEMSFSPDGSRLVYPELAGKEVGLWILDLATGEQRRLTDGTQ